MSSFRFIWIFFVSLFICLSLSFSLSRSRSTPLARGRYELVLLAKCINIWIVTLNDFVLLEFLIARLPCAQAVTATQPFGKISVGSLSVIRLSDGIQSGISGAFICVCVLQTLRIYLIKIHYRDWKRLGRHLWSMACVISCYSIFS